MHQMGGDVAAHQLSPCAILSWPLQILVQPLFPEAYLTAQASGFLTHILTSRRGARSGLHPVSLEFGTFLLELGLLGAGTKWGGRKRRNTNFRVRLATWEPWLYHFENG